MSTQAIAQLSHPAFLSCAECFSPYTIGSICDATEDLCMVFDKPCIVAAIVMETVAQL